MKTSWRNNSDSYTLWWNRTEKVISVAILAENDVFLRSEKVEPKHYVIVPSNTTLKLFLVSDN